MDTFKAVLRNIANFFFGTPRKVGYTFLGAAILYVIYNIGKIVDYITFEVSRLLNAIATVLINQGLPIILVIAGMLWLVGKAKGGKGSSKK